MPERLLLRWLADWLYSVSHRRQRRLMDEHLRALPHYVPIRPVDPLMIEHQISALLSTAATGPAAHILDGHARTADAVESSRERRARSLAETARGWAIALTSRAYIPMSRAELCEALSEIAAKLDGADRAELPAVAARAGREFSRGLWVTPEAFSDFAELLIPWIQARHLGADAAGQDIATRTIAALASGFAAGTRARVLDEQIRMAENRIVQQQRAHEAVLRNPLAFDHLMHGDEQPMLLLDRRGTILSANHPACQLLVLPDISADGAGSHILEDCAFADADADIIRNVLEDLHELQDPFAPAETRRTAPIHIEFCVAWPEGTFRALVAVTLCWHRTDETTPTRVCVVLHDVTQDRTWRGQLEHLASRDEMTDLPSRRTFLQRAQRALDDTGTGAGGTLLDLPCSDQVFAPADDLVQGRQTEDRGVLAIAVIKLDGLTRITHELGAHHGQTLLSTLTTRLGAAVAGMSGTTIARLDRDVVAVLLTDSIGWDAIADTVKRIANWLAEPVRSGNQHLHITPRIAVAEGIRGETEASDLLVRAEHGLDADSPTHQPWLIAVTTGREANSDRTPDPYGFIDSFDRSTTPTQPAATRTRLIADLPTALSDRALRMMYSPIARVADGAIVGLQTHLCWDHPDFGEMLIDDLVELADQLGLALPLSRWMLDHATRHAARWRRALRHERLPSAEPFVHITVPANLARHELLVEHARAALTATGLPPHRLHLGLPGTAMLTSHGTPRSHLTGLDAMGVCCVLNGVGHSYAEIDTLPALPLHGIALPPSITKGMRDPATNPGRRAPAHTIVNLATSLNLSTLLRGIVAPDQLHDAKMINATYAHGTLIGLPLPAEDIEALLHDAPTDLPHMHSSDR